MRIIAINDFIQEDDNVEYLVDGLLPNVGWTLFIGRESIGKTTFAMQMCAAMDKGVKFLGRCTKKTKVLYVQADSDIDEWRVMLKRIANGSKALTVVEVPSQALGNPSYVGWMKQAIDKVKPGFIVFDSLYNLSHVSLNSEAILLAVNQMKALSHVNGSKIPWLLIHHPRKEDGRAAGHNSLEANCSNYWMLSKTKLKVSKGRIVDTAGGKSELSLSRDEKGLWCLHDEGHTTREEDILDRPILYGG